MLVLPVMLKRVHQDGAMSIIQTSISKYEVVLNIVPSVRCGGHPMHRLSLPGLGMGLFRPRAALLP